MDSHLKKSTSGDMENKSKDSGEYGAATFNPYGEVKTKEKKRTFKFLYLLVLIGLVFTLLAYKTSILYEDYGQIFLIADMVLTAVIWGCFVYAGLAKRGKVAFFYILCHLAGCGIFLSDSWTWYQFENYVSIGTKILYFGRYIIVWICLFLIRSLIKEEKKKRRLGLLIGMGIHSLISWMISNPYAITTSETINGLIQTGTFFVVGAIACNLAYKVYKQKETVKNK